MKYLVSVIAGLLILCVSPVKANQQYWVYVISGGKVVCDGISIQQPSIGWDGRFFQFGKGQQTIKSLGCDILWSTEPIQFDPRVIQP